MVNRGSNDGLKLGNPIANDSGILGQVVRIYDHSAEVSLLEDRDFAVPVQVARNGLRAAVFGAGRGNPLELRYLPVASDLEVGDVLITSSIDGVYPPGFAVAVISPAANAPPASRRTIWFATFAVAAVVVAELLRPIIAAFGMLVKLVPVSVGVFVQLGAEPDTRTCELVLAANVVDAPAPV